MTSRWQQARLSWRNLDRRIKGTVMAWFVVGVAMILLGMEPRLVLLGFIVLATASTGWLVFDLGLGLSPHSWHNPVGRSGARDRPDLRVQILRSRLRRRSQRPAPRLRKPNKASDGDNAQPNQPVNEVADSLLAVLDSHVLHEHGIDRHQDPEAAAAVLGPTLGPFVVDESARNAMTRRRTLATTIGLIEDLTLPRHPANARPQSHFAPATTKDPR